MVSGDTILCAYRMVVLTKLNVSKRPVCFCHSKMELETSQYGHIFISADLSVFSRDILKIKKSPKIRFRIFGSSRILRSDVYFWLATPLMLIKPRR